MSLHGCAFWGEKPDSILKVVADVLLGHVSQVADQTTTRREETFMWLVRLLQRNRPQNVVRYSLGNQTPLGLERIKWLFHPPCSHDFTMNKNQVAEERKDEAMIGNKTKKGSHIQRCLFHVRVTQILEVESTNWVLGTGVQTSLLLTDSPN